MVINIEDILKDYYSLLQAYQEQKDYFKKLIKDLKEEIHNDNQSIGVNNMSEEDVFKYLNTLIKRLK